MRFVPNWLRSRAREAGRGGDGRGAREGGRRDLQRLSERAVVVAVVVVVVPPHVGDAIDAGANALRCGVVVRAGIRLARPLGETEEACCEVQAGFSWSAEPEASTVVQVGIVFQFRFTSRSCSVFG